MLLTCLCLFASINAFAYDFEVNGIYYNILSETDRSVSVVSQSNSKYSGDIIIPESVFFEGVTYTVDAIGGYAFEFCDNMTSVTIPGSLKSIGYHAFCYCTGLTTFTIPSSVTSIGGDAFVGCIFLNEMFVNNSSLTDENNWGAVLCDRETEDGLLIKGTVVVKCRAWATSVAIPEGMTDIDYDAFRNCRDLTSVTIPSSVTTIYGGAFEDCSGLTSIIIPEGVTNIGEFAFYNCTSLTSVTLPESLMSIENAAFRDCSSLTSINIPEGITIINNSLFSGCKSLTSINIPNGVTSIDSGAFKDCGLASIVIPESVTSISGPAFQNCPLDFVYMKNETPVRIVSTTFTCRGYAVLIVPEGCRATYKAAQNWSDFKYMVEMKPVIDGIYYNLDKENMVAEVTQMIVRGTRTDRNGKFPTMKFSDYRGELVIPSQVTYKDETYNVTGIGEDAFSGFAYGINDYGQVNSELVSVTLPQSVTSIGRDAFGSCSGLVSVNIPDGVTYIGRSAFYRCSSLASITIPEGMTSIEEGTFFGCSSLTSFVIPNCVTSVGEGAFGGCTSLTSLTIGSSVASLGGWAFEECPLREIYCYAEEPPTPGPNTIDYRLGYGNILLVVPENAVDKYKANQYWMQFWIETPTGINEIENGRWRFENSISECYNLNGHKIINGKLPSGINIIRMSDGTTRKVLKK